MRVAAIDTDTKGSIAVLDTDTNEVMIYALPNTMVKVNKTQRKRLDVGKTVALCRHVLQQTDAVFLEKQNARPKQGVTSSFTFGQTYGTLIGVVFATKPSDCKVEYVTGAEWKAALGMTKDKKKTVAHATRLAPEIKGAWAKVMHTSAAEAFLICIYGASASGVALQRKPISAMPASTIGDMAPLT